MDIEGPVMVKIAERLGGHPAVLWGKRPGEGQTPIPSSHWRRNYLSTLKDVGGEPLTNDETKVIAGLDKNCRLTKDQAFLWQEGQTWQNLWHRKGEIMPP